MAVQAHATAKYVRTSAQKAGLVLDLIRGRDVNSALATLRYARKGVARDIEKVLRSAIANASQKDGFGGDVENLYVNACYANQGPSQKRIRPAPMGRAFRVVKRTAHLTVQVAERPVHIAAAPEPAAAPTRAGEGETRAGDSRPKRPRGAKPKAKAKPAAKKTATAKRGTKAGAGKKKTASKGGRAKTAKS
jgi:large subunit ribosomal protein L22